MLFSDEDITIPNMDLARYIFIIGFAFSVTISPLIGFYLIASVSFYVISYIVFYIKMECEELTKYVEEYKSENGIE